MYFPTLSAATKISLPTITIVAIWSPLLTSSLLDSLLDWSTTNEQPNNSWNGVWFAKTSTFDGGWTLEIRFPFRSFRYRLAKYAMDDGDEPQSESIPAAAPISDKAPPGS